MIKPQNRQQLLVWVAAAAVALLAGDYLVVEPLLRSWKARSTELVRLRKSVEDGTQLIARSDGPRGLRARWTAMRSNTLSNQTSLAENQMLRGFEKWTQEARVGVSAVKPQMKRGDDDYATLECRVDAFGNLPSLTRLLYNLEADPLALRVDVLELTARDDKGEQLTLGLQVGGLILDPPSTR